MIKRFSNLSLATKIVLMVGLLGLTAVLTTLYALSSMRLVDREYSALISREGRSALLIDDALLKLSDSSRLLHSVLTEQEVSKMRAAQQTINGLQQQFEATMRQVYPLMPTRKAELDRILDTSVKSFSVAASVVDSAAIWRGDRALLIIHNIFEPQMFALQIQMDQLRNAVVDNFEATSLALNETTDQTILATTMAAGLALILGLMISGYVTIVHVSRPIGRLTAIMGRLTGKNYDDEITGTDRHDEVGSMAKALQVFKDSMQRADRLEHEARASAEARDVAEQAVQAKAAFLATMSHEIRTPLNGILGLAQISLKDNPAPKLKERLEKMLRAGQHLLSIINDILDFSKIDSNNLSVETTEVDIVRLVDSAVEMVAQGIAEKGLVLSINIDDSVPGVMVGDPVRIGQVLLNYLNNAIKFTEKGEISIRMSAQPDGLSGVLLRCEVKDTGIGMSAGQIEGLFQAFQQADTSITRRFGGTGLGLVISKRLAELMGGQVGVSSVLGQGSMFWFTVRLGRSLLAGKPDMQRAAVQDYRGIPDISELWGCRILLVDDNELNQMVAVDLLELGGVQVDVAGNGQVAIDMLVAAPDGTYAAVLMDMMMPVMDGLTATRVLCANPRFQDLPIIAMSANASGHDVADGKAAGMAAHIAKPVDEVVLWQTLLLCIKDPDVHQDMALPVDAMAVHHAVAKTTGLRRADAFLDRDVRHALAAEEMGVSLLDEVVLDRMRGAMQPARFRRMLQVLIDDGEARSLGIVAAAQVADFEGLDQMAHDLIGVAGNAGLRRLSALGTMLKQASRSADLEQSRQLAVWIRQTTIESVQVLRERFSEEIQVVQGARI